MPENNTQTQNYKTVFILGAGASYDFGFPTGEELLRDVDDVCGAIETMIEGIKSPAQQITVNQILNNTQTKDLHPDFIRQQLGVDSEIGYFTVSIWKIFVNKKANLTSYAQRLRNGLPLSKSIDNFLNDQQDEEFKNFGKMVIAAALLSAERRGLAPLNGKPRRELIPWRRFHANQPPNFFELRDTWFTTFFRELRNDNGKPNQGIEGFKNRLRQIAVITFNYERSFEYLMREAIKEYQQGISYEEIDDIMSCLTIIHPYGDLGDLKELPFGAHPKTIEDWSVFQERIQIFMEPANKDVQTDAQEVIQSAEKLVFLGFGFHEQNMEFLGVTPSEPSLNPLKQIYATAYKESDYRANNLKSKLALSVGDHALQRAIENEICLPLDEAKVEAQKRLSDINFAYNDQIKADEISKRLLKVENADCKEFLYKYADDIFNFD